MAKITANKKFWTEGWGSFGIAIGIALLIRWSLMEAYVIPSASMLPSLLIHDHIFVNKLVYGVRVPFSEKWLVEFKKPVRGEVIVFKYPLDKGTFFIKRVVGVPGDEISYENGKLILNGKQLETAVPTEDEEKMFSQLRDADFRAGGNILDATENYVHLMEKLPPDSNHPLLLRKGESFGNNSGPWTVGERELFVMGDNRDNSHDSRRWGFVPEENVLGRAMFVWLSCEDTLPVVSFLCNPATIRWNRFFYNVR